jgi:hypothetical protein
MKRWVLVAALFVAAACDTRHEAAAPHRIGTPEANLDPALAAALTTAAPTTRLVVIVNYDETAPRRM